MSYNGEFRSKVHKDENLFIEPVLSVPHRVAAVANL